MIQQFLALEYGNTKRLKQKLDDYLGNGCYEIVERSGNQWQIMIFRKLDKNEVEEIQEHVKQHYKSTT
ncbi:uncharacterized protein FFUJ_05174 [Fusarium fujikuroi IMI 58289]|uniref:Uncharacterized protein n=1 Tax=Gibberella fujikuroi (strain CBS 195.34 / IMI 58289 / NRRL A-6831) TaxID=1279085 RepID=S0DSW5_GIBF5|nr:uncharacterized protein FFUJ_05174 [Fusarium fujikuroi IMI 58289]KLP03698.1 uncharacterized protein Y057_1531 [Fusarium fujikuroi]QGI59950.1 hypothetical protein CEK27_003921 [Fusarium fujikuroi]QGI77153.1 hypothetical protein CEK25_003882 [Fusarium fujikuroi]QGI90860.1 hypothetical protein CEK26_003929 [Fusarium fujikuroi]CCT63673.1 uncharacterized protein FFUJ_05174 [Fusarium fujikuroi IMI 58289]